MYAHDPRALEISDILKNGIATLFCPATVLIREGDLFDAPSFRIHPGGNCSYLAPKMRSALRRKKVRVSTLGSVQNGLYVALDLGGVMELTWPSVASVLGPLSYVFGELLERPANASPLITKLLRNARSHLAINDFWLTVPPDHDRCRRNAIDMEPIPEICILS